MGRTRKSQSTLLCNCKRIIGKQKYTRNIYQNKGRKNTKINATIAFCKAPKTFQKCYHLYNVLYTLFLHNHYNTKIHSANVFFAKKMEPFAPWDASATFFAKKMEPTVLRTACSTRKTKYGRKRPILFSLVEPTVGFEPTTYGLQNRCSTS